MIRYCDDGLLEISNNLVENATKAVNNARDDKLMTPMWKASFQNRRCIIPVTQWAEAEGQNSLHPPRGSNLTGNILLEAMRGSNPRFG